MPKTRGVNRPPEPFRGPLVAILDFAGGERVPPLPLGWYFKIYFWMVNWLVHNLKWHGKTWTSCQTWKFSSNQILLLNVRQEFSAWVKLWISLAGNTTLEIWSDMRKMGFGSLTLSGLILWNTSPGRGGGRSAHPWIMAIGACFHYFLVARALSLDVKGQSLKAQLSTSQNIAMRAFGKTAISCKIWKK